MYLAPRIREQLRIIRQQCTDCHKTPIAYHDFVQLFAPFLKKFRSTVKMTLNDFPENDFSISGLFEPHKTKLPITIQFNFSQHSYTLLLDSGMMDELFFNVYEILQHEHIHLMQQKYRHDGEECGNIRMYSIRTMSKDQKYLSEKDEIASYSHDIALEIFEQYPNKNPFEVLQNISRYGIVSYTMYENTFAGSDWNKIRKKLLSLTYSWVCDIIWNKWQYRSVVQLDRLNPIA